jgi:hypothetical protein
MRMAYRERGFGLARRDERGCCGAGLRPGPARGVLAGFGPEPEFEAGGGLPLCSWPTDAWSAIARALSPLMRSAHASSSPRRRPFSVILRASGVSVTT